MRHVQNPSTVILSEKQSMIIPEASQGNKPHDSSASSSGFEESLRVEDV
jgi:hypothetical protein